ncbi:hypothetical protein BB987_03245 [Photorhabdus temperata]|uniref:hypothetical protein n=1 Tax=Photorhabdus khanii TaxID=1004150 RepID=UPI0004B000CA|nr:hypothetical protein [Photorhabdus khanii]OHV49196.1 hypothetical protein BB987_03245 [Photorhabdus temperata]
MLQAGEKKTQIINNILSKQEITEHEKYMREAIKEAIKNPKYPFGAVIVNRNNGETQAINHYITQYGNQGWENDPRRPNRYSHTESGWRFTIKRNKIWP